MKNTFEAVIFGTWLVGVFVCWTYLIAYHYQADGELTRAVILGWVPALFWPLILMVQAWLTWWF